MKMFNKQVLKSAKEMVRDEVTGRLRAKDQLEEVMHEIEVMKKINNDFLVRLHEVINTEDSVNLAMIIDFCGRGQVMDWDEKTMKFTPCFNVNGDYFKEVQIQRIMREVVCGLDYLHKNLICHRDIKPQNVLVTIDGISKLADFGSAKEIKADDDTLRGSVGTYHFFAPELCDPEVKEYSGTKVDIWALGITMYALIFNKLPFNAESPIELLDTILQTEIGFGDRNLSKGLHDIIHGMLERDPKQRWDMQKIKSCEWINAGYTVRLDSDE